MTELAIVLVLGAVFVVFFLAGQRHAAIVFARIRNVEPESRCYAVIDLGSALSAKQPRSVHWYKRRGEPASDTCRRCGAPNPRYKAEAVTA